MQRIWKTSNHTLIPASPCQGCMKISMLEGTCCLGCLCFFTRAYFFTLKFVSLWHPTLYFFPAGFSQVLEGAVCYNVFPLTDF